MLVDEYGYEEYEEPEEGEEITTTDEWGIVRHSIYLGGEWNEGYDDPGWDYVYDEDGNSVSCPNYGCGAEELRYHNGQCCCIECMNTFTDEEIEDYAGPWHHC